MCDVKKMFLFVLKRDKICFGGILDNFCYSVQSVVGWNLGAAFLVVIFPMKSGGAFWGGGRRHFRYVPRPSVYFFRGDGGGGESAPPHSPQRIPWIFGPPQAEFFFSEYWKKHWMLWLPNEISFPKKIHTTVPRPAPPPDLEYSSPKRFPSPPPPKKNAKEF